MDLTSTAHFKTFSAMLMRLYFCLIIFLCYGTLLFAQPANDNCAAAEVINIPSAGYAFGTFTGSTVRLQGSTLEATEYIHPAQVAKAKSIWYKFTLPTTREVIVTIKQPGVGPYPMPATYCGWTLYRGNSCFPGATEVVDPPIINIEGYTHRCLRAGSYMLQITGNLFAVDSIFPEITVGPSTATEILYDNAAQPLNFGLVSGLNPTGSANQFYEVGCQSLFDGEIPCPNANYTQSTWHVFTTDNNIDFFRFEVGENPWVLPGTPARTFGYRLYKGNCALDSIADGNPAGGVNLTQIGNCQTLTQTYSSTYAATWNTCELEPNTTYSIQLFIPTGYSRQINVRVYETGNGVEQSENPTAIVPAHQLGVLPFGTTTSGDYLTCEGQMKYFTSCNSMVPATGYYLSGADTFDLASYRTFEIGTQTNVTFYQNIANQPTLYFRIYQGDVTTAGCAGLTYYADFYGSRTFYCLPAGKYTIQIMGMSEVHNIFYYWRSNLGKYHSLSINVAFSYSESFGLHTSSEIDNIFSGNPLPSAGGVYRYAVSDTLDCRTTVLPAGDVCGTANDRAIYRRIVIGQDGILTVGGGNWWRFSYRLYRGDAQIAPISGGRLQGLTDLMGCQSLYYPYKLCVTPGVYTLVSFGDPTDVGESDRPWAHFETFGTMAFNDPLNPNLLDSVTITRPTVSGLPSRFNCPDNPLTINGYAPCGGATKQIYREVYIAQPSLLSFNPTQSYYMVGWAGVNYRWFNGRLSQNNVTGLYRDCSGGFTACVPPGWYTIVCYGTQANIGDVVNISITIDPRVQNYRSIALAENANNGNPMNWYFHTTGGSTQRYPRNDTTYTLATDFWDCANDLPFDAGITPCVAGYNRASYRVFTLGKPSYLMVYNLNPWPYNYQSRLYYGDLRTQTPPFSVAHECVTSEMRICDAPAGTYTLVTFANDGNIGQTHTPVIYIDSVGVSRFDHASNAYNFGNIPNNNTEYLGNPVDPPGPFGRAPSSDFFFCTTGANVSDPNNNCPIGSNPPANPLPQPTNPRRNIWYTFTVTGPGRVYVSVYNRTPRSTSQSPFTVYYSPNTSIPPIDSTLAQGLQFVETSTTWWCGNYQTISYYIDPCAGSSVRRYYVEVQNNAYNEPNVQVEVGIRFEPAPPTFVLFDHYSQANQINANPTTQNLPPYSPLSVVSGTYSGYTGNLNCATRDATDQNSCGTRTLWYAFDVGKSGRIRLNYTRPAAGNVTQFSTSEVMLFREMIPGDSSTSGLLNIPLNTIWVNGNIDFNPASYYNWGEACVYPGRYYIMFTGCSFPTETVFPRIWMIPTKGDLCSDPNDLTIPAGGGSFTTTSDITCHTIGEAPGEDGTNMGCLGGPVGLKSQWFKIDLGGTTKYNVDIELTEATNATSSDIRYRVGYGDCNTMTFDNCVSEGLHIILNLKCRLPGPFYVQVTMPEWASGNVTLNFTATPVTDTNCFPVDPIRPRANFAFTASCVDTAVYFNNLSTQGTGVTYFWDFGDSTYSTQFEPIHMYADTGTYQVMLVVDNGLARDTMIQFVTVYPVPEPNFTIPATAFAGEFFNITNTSTTVIPGATYYWNFCAGAGPCGASIPFYYGPNPPPISYLYGGTKTICLTISNANCDSVVCKTIQINYTNIFSGGPYDGQSNILVSPNCIQNIFAGGPYDGFSDFVQTSNCIQNIFAGGTYDGFSNLVQTSSCIENIFAGGPYDGNSILSQTSNCVLNIFAGGPYDGFSNIVQTSNCVQNIFAGGPYDGFSNVVQTSTCIQNIFAGGPYDGFSNVVQTSTCVQNIFAGGPYDGHSELIQTSFCSVTTMFSGGPYDGNSVLALYGTCIVPDTNIFAGGPYDGNSELVVTATCVQNIFAGGPYDGHHELSLFANCPVNIFAGGPYDGHSELVQTSVCTQNIFAGGPYDGHSELSLFSNCPVNIFAGGPYDGHSELVQTSVCVQNIFAGGPYDGFSNVVQTSTCTQNIFAGGPYDGQSNILVSANCLNNIFAGGPYDGQSNILVSANCIQNIFAGGPYDGFSFITYNAFNPTGDSICAGDVATLTTSAPTNWYNVPTGGTALATNTASFVTPPLSQTTIYYAENLCAGGRAPVIAQVNQVLSPDFNYAQACVGEPIQFYNQTIVTTAPTNSIGNSFADISLLGATGAVPAIGRISFSSAAQLNYNQLWDNVHNGYTAWQGNNAAPSTQWVQWNYVTPKSVNRFYYWNYWDNTYANRAPKQLRLYYSTGGPWILIKIINPPYPSTGVFDTGIISETNGIFANRWKLELDVEAYGPMWGEFQVQAGVPGLGGNVSWDFGDGGTSTAQNPAHVYSGTGPYTATLSVNNNGCISTFNRIITPCDQPLPISQNYLAGKADEAKENILLDWEITGTFTTAELQKFYGSWVLMDTFSYFNGQSKYSFVDPDPFYNANNLYRVAYKDVNGSVSYSNIAEVTIDQIPAEAMVVYPNPVSQTNLFVDVSVAKESPSEIVVYNSIGQQMYTKKLLLKAGKNNLEIETQNLSAGMYYVEIQTDYTAFRQKFMVIRK